MTQNEYEIYTYNSHNIYILVFSKLHKYLVPTYILLFIIGTY